MKIENHYGASYIYPPALWGFLQLKSELIRKAETQKIREKQTNMALFLRRKSLNNLKNDE